MKHGRKPTVKQCNMIRAAGLNVENWLVVKDTPELMDLVHRHSDRTRRTIHKEVKER